MRTKSPRAKIPASVEGLSIEGVPRNRRVLVGASGGMDSTALVHALAAAGYRKVTLAHLNHGLRGEQSDRDAAFVRRLARRLELPVIVERIDVGALARKNKASIETAAREARYAFFARAARQARCRALVLAHHADDQAETVLFNLLRGGGSGLGGMLARSVRELDGVSLEVIRPWLGVWRAEIEAYVAQRKIKYREDASNLSPEHTRNRVRRRILPMLSKELGRDVRPGLWRAAEILAAQQDWLTESLALTGERLPTAALLALPLALQRHAIHEWLRQWQVPDVSFALVEAVRAIAPPDAATAKINLPGGGHARRRAGELFVENVKSARGD